MKTETKDEVITFAHAAACQMLGHPVMQQLVGLVARREVEELARTSALTGSIMSWELNQPQINELAQDIVAQVAERLGATQGDIGQAVQNELAANGGIVVQPQHGIVRPS